MHTLATLHALRQHIGISADATNEDARLYAALRTATRQIERHTARTFRPYHAELAHSVNLRARHEVLLVDDLLELHGVSCDGTPLALANVVLLRGGVLRLINGLCFNVTRETAAYAVHVRGIWGWHDDWHNAWRASGDNLQADVGAHDVLLPVADVSGGDGDGIAPRFQVGQLLLIGNEYLAVIGVDAAAHTLKVARGQRGTQAQAHATGAAIARYQPPHDAENACLRWAYRLYREVDAPADIAPKPLQDWVMSMRKLRY